VIKNTGRFSLEGIQRQTEENPAILTYFYNPILSVYPVVTADFLVHIHIVDFPISMSLNQGSESDSHSVNGKSRQICITCCQQLSLQPLMCLLVTGQVSLYETWRGKGFF
jgi:hypothetical protein